MNKVSLKYFIGLMLFVIVCQASIVQTDEEDLAEGLDLSENQNGQFFADSEEAVQATVLNDQTRGNVHNQGNGNGQGRRPLIGGCAVTRYLRKSLVQKPLYIDFDDNNIYFNQIGDLKNDYSYNENTNAFRCGNGWGDLSHHGQHYRAVSKLFVQVVRIQYINNFFRCYNIRNQVIIILQRVVTFYKVGGVWGRPLNQRKCLKYPQEPHPYKFYAWGVPSVGSTSD